MNFNADGYLDAGLYDLTLEAIEEHFVVAFPTSTTRKPIIEGYKRHRSDVLVFNFHCEQFINGSFTSTKNDPGDIDLVGFVNMDLVDALAPAQKVKFEALFDGKNTKSTHHCDAYYCPTVPEHHPLYAQLRSSRKYWMGEFGYDRQDKPKGMIRTNVSPTPPAGSV